MSRRAIRCAIYTRKSSDDGLEQEFNSLHAQREACASYISSQRGEGWVLCCQSIMMMAAYRVERWSGQRCCD